MNVREWPERLTVEVTADDIARGEPQTCATCPIALAARRLLGVPVEVGFSSIEAYAHAYADEDSVPVVSWAMPQSAKDFIVRFDDGNPVEPFTFTAERAR